MDVQRINYGDVDSIANKFDPLLDGSCIPGPTGGTGDGCLGASKGAGFGWDDMTIYKVGAQWSSSEQWTWRMGYSYGDQPIPSSEVTFNILAPAVIEHHVTFGFTRFIGKDKEFDFAAMYAFENEQSGANRFDPSQEIELEMYQWEVEANFSWVF